MFRMVHVSSANMEKAGFLACTAASHQVGSYILASLLGALMLSFKLLVHLLVNAKTCYYVLQI